MAKRPTVYSRGVVRVMAERCPTCIFRPGNLMRLQSGRVKSMLADIGDEGCIPCHSTLDLPEQAVCRGQYDVKPTLPIRVAESMGVIEWTPHPTDSD